MDIGRAAIFRCGEEPLVVLVEFLQGGIVRCPDVGESVVLDFDVGRNAFFFVPAVEPLGERLEHGDVAGETPDDLLPGQFLMQARHELLFAEAVDGQRLLVHATVELPLLISETGFAADTLHQRVLANGDAQLARFAVIQRFGDQAVDDAFGHPQAAGLLYREITAQGSRQVLHLALEGRGELL